jgi:hypothetical protein
MVVVVLNCYLFYYLVCYFGCQGINRYKKIFRFLRANPQIFRDSLSFKDILDSLNTPKLEIEKNKKLQN